MKKLRKNIWLVLLREFRRFLLDFAEAKKHQSSIDFAAKFKKSGGFVEDKKDNRIFERAMLCWQLDTYQLRTTEPFKCRAADKKEMEAQGKIFLDIFEIPQTLRT